MQEGLAEATNSDFVSPAREDKIKGVHSDSGEAQQWDGAASKRLMDIQHVGAFPKHARDSYTPKVHKTVGLPQAKKRKTDKTGGYQAIGQAVGCPILGGPHGKGDYSRANTQIPNDGLLEARHAGGGHQPPLGPTATSGGDRDHGRGGKGWQAAGVPGGGRDDTRKGQSILRVLRVWHNTVPTDSGQGRHSNTGHMLGADHGRHTGSGHHNQAMDGSIGDHGGALPASGGKPPRGDSKKARTQASGPPGVVACIVPTASMGQRSDRLHTRQCTDTH